MTPFPTTGLPHPRNTSPWSGATLQASGGELSFPMTGQGRSPRPPQKGPLAAPVRSEIAIDWLSGKETNEEDPSD